ncbi:unnamed protein product, partial [Laminaria digitata]
GAVKEPPKNSRAAGLKSDERVKRENSRQFNEEAAFEQQKLLFERERASVLEGRDQGGKTNGKPSEFPDMGGGFLTGGIGNGDNSRSGGGGGDDDYLGGGIEDESPAPASSLESQGLGGGGEGGQGQPNERPVEKKQEPLGSFMNGFFGGGRQDGDVGGAGGGGGGRGEKGGAGVDFPGGGAGAWSGGGGG